MLCRALVMAGVHEAATAERVRTFVEASCQGLGPSLAPALHAPFRLSKACLKHDTPFHAYLSPATQIWPFSLLVFWDKNTGICAGAISYRRGFRPLPGSRHFKLKGGHFVSWC